MSKKATAKEPFLPFFVGDFVAATSEWEGEAASLYAWLLLHQWAIGSIPADPKRICKLARWDWELFEEHWKTVRRKFRRITISNEDGDSEERLVNPRLELHRQKTAELRRKNSESGAKGARARWGKDGERHSEGMANATHINSARHRSGIASATEKDGDRHTKRHPKSDGALDGNPSHPIPSHPIDSEQGNNSALEGGAGGNGSPGDPSAGSDKAPGRKRANGHDQTKAPAKRRRIPPEHPTEPFREWAKQHTPNVDFDTEIAMLRDHQFRDAHSDWDAVIRNWLRRAQKHARPQRAPSNRPSRPGASMTHAEVMAALDAAVDPNSEDFE